MPWIARVLPLLRPSRAWLAVLGLLLGSACVSTEGPALERRTSVPHLAASAVTVRLIDARPAVDQEALSISTFTLPSQEQELVLPLTPAFEARLQEDLARELVPAARTLHLEVTVRAAHAGWDAGYFTESEYARAELGIVAHDERQTVLASGTTESWARRTSMDTSASAVRRMFDNVLRDALLRFLAGPQGAALRRAEE